MDVHFQAPCAPNDAESLPPAVAGVNDLVGSQLPSASSATIMSAATANPGSNWTAFGSQVCTALDIVNNTGVAIEYRRNGAGSAMPIPTGTARMVLGITNANQISIRRVDQSNTPVTVAAEALVA